MNNLGTRPTRSRVSNYSINGSNLNSLESLESTSGSQISQKFLDGWVEPVVPPPRPSYADAGIERHGVVQNMAPLGCRPSMKVLKAAALLKGTEDLIRPVRLGKTEAPKVLNSARSVMTPEPSETLSSGAFQNMQELQKEKTSTYESIEDGSSLSSISEEQISPKSQSVSTSVSQTFSNSVTEPKQFSSVLEINGSDSEIFQREFSNSTVTSPSTGKDGLPVVNTAQTDRVVELAVQNAVESKRWPTAYALRTLYDDNRSDISFVRLLESVYYNYATEKDLEEFERLLKPKKFEGRKDHTGENYFNFEGSNSAARRPIFSAIEAINPPAPAYVTPYSSLPNFESTSSVESSTLRSKSLTVNDTSNDESPSSTALSVSSEPRHLKKRLRTKRYLRNHFLESSNETVNSPSLKSPTQAIEEQPNSKTRSVSVSSSSSLSSIDMNLIDEVSNSPSKPITNHGLATLGLFGVQPVFISPYANANNFKKAASSADSEARNRVNSVTIQQNSGPKTHTFTVSPSKNSESVNKRQSSEPLLTSSESVPTTGFNTTEDSKTVSLKFPAKRNLEINVTADLLHDVNDERRTKWNKSNDFAASNSNVKVTESFERIGSQLSLVSKKEDNQSKVEEKMEIVPHLPVKRPQQVRLNHNIDRKNLQGIERNFSNDSGCQSSFASDNLSQSSLTTQSSIIRTIKRNKHLTSLRIKSSPIKKKSGTPAGIPKVSNLRTSPIKNNFNDENDDFCSSCGGNGEVVCCDGDTCKRSFHFKCVDPPIMPDTLSETWFCNECRVKQVNYSKEKTDAFGLLLLQLERKDFNTFSLPSEIREYFEGVKTGPEGEYEEIVVPKPKMINRSGWEEVPDYFKKRDNKGRPILCHRCGLQAGAPDRLIIPCSFCNLYWHLDCLDVPLAKEPAPGRLWQCQAHVDDLLKLIPSTLAPAHRFRKIKGAPLIQPSVPRGPKNHGHIEISNEQTDDEGESQSSFYEERPFGRICKISEQSIKLDFLLRVKKEGGGYTRARFSDARKKKKFSWSEANLSDQQAALNLRALANSDPSLNGLENLITTLLVEAPPNVINLIAQGDAERLASDQSQLKLSDKKSLLALQMFINKKLNYLDKYETEEPLQKKLRTSKRISGPPSKK